MTENLDRDIGARIKKVRKEKGMTQEELGFQLGITYQQVQKYESGQNRVSASRLTHIARIMDCPPSVFFEDNKREAIEGFAEAKDTPFISQEALSFAIELDFVKDEEIRKKMVELVRSISKHAV